jgi:hypothetical protein
MLVVVRDVLVQDRPEVPLPGDQQPVGDLSPGCAHPPLGVSIGPHRQPRLGAAERASNAIHPASRTNIRYSIRTITSPRYCQPSGHHGWHTRRSATYAPVLEPHRRTEAVVRDVADGLG